MTFRDRLVATLRALRPVLETPGVMIAGSEVPNLLEAGAASTLVVSEDVDVAVSVDVIDEVCALLPSLHGLHPSPSEPSVFLPAAPNELGLIEVNFIGFDPKLQDPEESYVLEREELSLLVFGSLSLLLPPRRIQIDDFYVAAPSIAGLILEKLMTERSGKKGDRDLLVVAGLLDVASPADLEEFASRFRRLPEDLQAAVESNLSVLSLLSPVDGMPDPRPRRAKVAGLLDAIGSR